MKEDLEDVTVVPEQSRSRSTSHRGNSDQHFHTSGALVVAMRLTQCSCMSVRVQVTVIFLADVASCLPSAEDWPAIWVEQQNAKRAKAAHDEVRMLELCKSSHVA